MCRRPHPAARYSPAPLLEAARRSKAWPFEEARKIVARFERAARRRARSLFETGYGPSGLPHIGTFGEVARTTMVRHRLPRCSPSDAVPTRLICFSDDMDGLRKVPDNVPQPGDDARQYLDQPLTEVPDPFGEYESFGARQQCAAPRASSTASASTTSSCQRDRVLPLRPVRRDAAARCSRPTTR